MIGKFFGGLFGKKQAAQEEAVRTEGAICRLLCTEGTHKGKVFELKDGAEFGRHPECDVCLRDKSNDHVIARRHMSLVYSGEEWCAVCSGRAGTMIDGVLYCQGVDVVPLHEGSTIRIIDDVFVVLKSE